jgi:ATPase family associated with various cellular activities (AAA)
MLQKPKRTSREPNEPRIEQYSSKHLGPTDVTRTPVGGDHELEAARLGSKNPNAYPADMDDGRAKGESRSGGEGQPGQVDTRHTWDDLVLPTPERDLLRAIPQRVRRQEGHDAGGVAGSAPSGKPGMTALFVGTPGTGKTMAADLIAADLGLRVHKVDLAVVSSESELEEIVERAFTAAEDGGAIVVIDGAGPLMGRSPAPGHDEVNPARTQRRDLSLVAPARNGLLPDLLERSYEYPGLVIFTSTVTHGLDLSLTDRFDVVVEFPFPESDARREIWRNSLPEDARLTESTLGYLATWLHWPGGTIHRCSLAAADEAATEGVPVELRHVASVLDHGYRSATPEETLASPEIRPRLEEPPSDTGRHRWRWIAVAGAAIAAALGLIIAGGNGSAPASNAGSKTASVGPVRVSFPSDWRQEAVPVGQSLGLTREVAIASPAPARGVLVIGTMAAVDPATLPRPLLATVSPGAAPEIVRVDQVVLERYPSRPSSGATGHEAIFAMPATSGTIIGVCRPEEVSSSFVGSCERVLGTMKLTTGAPFRWR